MRSDADRGRGLYRKFRRIERSDGSSARGKKHHRCRYFVLDLDHDEFADAAMRTYADACERKFPLLAGDIRAAAWAKCTVSP